VAGNLKDISPWFQKEEGGLDIYVHNAAAFSVIGKLVSLGYAVFDSLVLAYTP